MRHYTLLILSTLFLSLLACKSDEDLPQTESCYVFKFQTKVDAMKLDCGYYEKEKCSDEKKQEIREVVGSASLQEQVELGNKLHKDLPYPIANDPKKKALVEKIIDKMRPFLTNKDLEHKAFILESKDVNAFTIPGGNIYVTTGIMNAVQTEDELAYVIGHELGHNENGHTKELTLLYKYILQKESGSVWDYVIGIWTKLRSSYCNQSDEIECDITGIYLAYKAGYDPEKAIKAAKVLKKLDSPKPKNDIKKWAVDLLRTHPWSEDREKCLKNYIANAKKEVQCTKIYDGEKGLVNTRKDPLNVRKQPSLNAEKLGQLAKGEKVKLLCDCIKQQNGQAFIYVKNKQGLVGWVDKSYIVVQ